MQKIKSFFVQTIKPFLLKHKQFVMAAYIPVYFIWFHYLEVHVTDHYHLIQSPLDSLIPFCEYFVIPYYAWFIYVGAVVVFIGLRDSITSWKMGCYLLTGMTIFLIISTFYPNGLNLRPTTFEHDNIFITLVQYMYAVDTPTNVLPSLHVYNAIGMHAALTASWRMKGRRKIKIFSFILVVLIIMSTMLIKQHSVVDVLSGCLMALIMYIISYILLPKGAAAIRDKRKEKTAVPVTAEANKR